MTVPASRTDIVVDTGISRSDERRRITAGSDGAAASSSPTSDSSSSDKRNIESYEIGYVESATEIALSPKK